MTHAEDIMQAVAALLKEGKDTFRRTDIRDKIGITQDRWHSGYTAIFQSMRSDQAGCAPGVESRFQDVFRQVEYGVHTLTDYGKQLIKQYR